MRQIFTFIIVAVLALLVLGCSSDNSTAGSNTTGVSKVGTGKNGKTSTATGFINPQ